MVRKACLMGLLLIGLVNTGCCRWCERWCGHTAAPACPAPVAYAAPAQACVPCCPVVCCPSSPAPAAAGGQWQRQPYSP